MFCKNKQKNIFYNSFICEFFLVQFFLVYFEVCDFLKATQKKILKTNSLENF